MSSKLKQLREKAEDRGDFISPLLPANWIELKGRFTVSELDTILKAVKNNFIKANGNS